MAYKPTKLSVEAFEELRSIAHYESDEPMTDAEIEEMGVRVLRLFSILATPAPKPTGIQPTAREQKALDFLREEIKQGRSPSMRQLAQVVGLKSSRSGLRLLNLLIAKGWLYRDQNHVLRLLNTY